MLIVKNINFKQDARCVNIFELIMGELSVHTLNTEFHTIPKKDVILHVSLFISRLLGIIKTNTLVNNLTLRDLQNKLNHPIEIAPNVTLKYSTNERFAKVFAAEARKNPRYLYTATNELEKCLGCSETLANVKLVKACENVQREDETQTQQLCQHCYCRPMWLVALSLNVLLEYCLQIIFIFLVVTLLRESTLSNMQVRHRDIIIECRSIYLYFFEIVHLYGILYSLIFTIKGLYRIHLYMFKCTLINLFVFLIYTNVGNLLVALNPFERFSIYDDAVISQYQHYNKTAGESGSGKTFNSLQVMNYLATSADSKITSGQVRLLKNKFIILTILSGLSLRTTLPLETIRVTSQRAGERNFNIFYEVCAGLSAEDKHSYGIKEQQKFFYLNQDAKNFIELDEALVTLGFSYEQRHLIYKSIAAILHIGNIYFRQKRTADNESNAVEVGNEGELKWSTFLLAVDLNRWAPAFVHKFSKCDNGITTSSLTMSQALDNRDSLAMLLYEEIFKWVISKIGQHFKCPDSTGCISVVDYYGFEANIHKLLYKKQMLINSVNEKMESIFVKQTFHEEIATYIREGLSFQWKVYISYQNFSSIFIYLITEMLYLYDCILLGRLFIFTRCPIILIIAKLLNYSIRSRMGSFIFWTMSASFLKIQDVFLNFSKIIFLIKEIIVDILDGQGVKYSSDYQIGSNYVFLRERFADKLHSSRKKTRRDAAYIIQKTMRAYFCRRRYLEKKKAVIKIQAGFRGWKTRKETAILREQLFKTLGIQTRRNKRLKAYNDSLFSEETSEVICLFITLFLTKLQITTSYLGIPFKKTANTIEPITLENFAQDYFKGHLLEQRREPILTPFLHKDNDLDFRKSIDIFKLILKYMNDKSLAKHQLDDLGRCIVQQVMFTALNLLPYSLQLTVISLSLKGILNPCQRDEILVQICNQTYRNQDKQAADRGWRLAILAVGAFPVSEITLSMFISESFMGLDKSLVFSFFFQRIVKNGNKPLEVRYEILSRLYAHASTFLGCNVPLSATSGSVCADDNTSQSVRGSPSMVSTQPIMLSGQSVMPMQYNINYGENETSFSMATPLDCKIQAKTHTSTDDDNQRKFDSIRSNSLKDFESIRSLGTIGAQKDCRSRHLSSRCDYVPSEYSIMSVASRIKRIPVPNNSRDVDKFLDEVFDQVLSPHEFKEADVNSNQIAASIKGGPHGSTDYDTLYERCPINEENYSQVYNQPDYPNGSNPYDYIDRENMVDNSIDMSNISSQLIHQQTIIPPSTPVPPAPSLTGQMISHGKQAMFIMMPVQMNVYNVKIRLVNRRNKVYIKMYYMPPEQETITRSPEPSRKVRQSMDVLSKPPHTLNRVEDPRLSVHSRMERTLVKSPESATVSVHNSSPVPHNSMDNASWLQNRHSSQAKNELEVGQLPRARPRSSSPIKSSKQVGLNRIPQEIYTEPVVQNTVSNSEHLNPNKFRVPEINLVKEIQHKEYEALQKINERMKHLPPPVDNVRVFIPKKPIKPSKEIIVVPDEPKSIVHPNNFLPEKHESYFFQFGHFIYAVTFLSLLASVVPDSQASVTPNSQKPAVKYVKQPWKLTIRKEEHKVPPDLLNKQSEIPTDIKVAVIEAARKWPVYFTQIFEVYKILKTNIFTFNYYIFKNLKPYFIKTTILTMFYNTLLKIFQFKQFVRAKADFITKQSNLLSFKQGDIIELVPSPDGENAPTGSWLYGKIGNQFGSLPAQYVTPMDHSLNENETVAPLPLSSDFHEVGDLISGKHEHENGYKYTMMEFALNNFRGPKGFDNHTNKKKNSESIWYFQYKYYLIYFIL
uniref:Myosin motor domain-containing protein n=1 Tax=Heterorhabditis bacteriophora TaxID=37862 RepID=A0A1I7WYG5_HETBA